MTLLLTKKISLNTKVYTIGYCRQEGHLIHEVFGRKGIAFFILQR